MRLCECGCTTEVVTTSYTATLCHIVRHRLAVFWLLCGVPPRHKEHTMSRRNRKAAHAEVVKPVVAPVVEIVDELPTLADLPVEIDEEVAADNAKAGSVVKGKYKARYAERAAGKGLGKVAQRSCWDWLAQELAAECLDGSKIDIGRFCRTLEANGVDHSRWNNRSKGWEGRLRMTGRLALQRVVAEQGHLKTIEGATIDAPADWVAKFTN